VPRERLPGAVVFSEFFHRTLRHFYFAGGSDVADHSTLHIGKALEVPWFGIGIGKPKHVAGQIPPRVPFQFEHHRLFPPDKPDPSGHPTPDSAVDFSANHLFVNTPCHGL
jgi:hypothetical protein